MWLCVELTMLFFARSLADDFRFIFDFQFGDWRQQYPLSILSI